MLGFRGLTAIIELLLLLFAANGAPILARNLLGPRFAWPVDGGLRLRDGRPLFGPSKTVRGVVSALAVTTALAPLLGQHSAVGFAVAGLAMLGDLFSSFVKRRQGRPSSSRALGLDQIPESLLPALVCSGAFGLGWSGALLAATVFMVMELVLSVFLYALGVREQPY